VVLIGRLTALLRALVPGLAGMSGLSWSKFLPYNILGGVVWASSVAMLGYLAGASLAVVERRLGMVSNAVLGVVVLVLVVLWWRSHLRRRDSSSQ
jgi:undecaprenyl-diphosphatase